VTELSNETAVEKPAEPIVHERGYGGADMWALFMLVVVYTFNFIDRQIIGILAIPIKTELGLSDTQLSLMGGLAFGLFYASLGIPIAWLADRKNRVWIITIALSVWSAMTALCGAAQNFWQLFMARLGVGVGEAGGVAPAYSLISDYFPAYMRARAMSLYSFGIPIGSCLGIVMGGVLNNYLGWRAAFVIVGLLGVAIAPLFRLTVREPERGRFDGSAAKVEPAPYKDVMRTIKLKKSFWYLTLGAAFSSMMGYGLFFWLPSFFVRSFGADLPGFFTWLPEALVPAGAGVVLYASYFFGLILLFGGVLGIWLGGVLADRLGAADRAAYARVPAYAFLATLPSFLLGLLVENLLIVMVAFTVAQALALLWLGPVLAALQSLVGPNMRASVSALYLLINNLIGLGLGNLILGMLSDLMEATFGTESLRYALLSGSLFYIIAALLLFQAAKYLPADWED